MSNGGAVTKKLRRILVLCGLAGALFGLSGCGDHIAFEKVDLKGHVRVEREGRGFCFHVPKNWEIREKLEGADVVCLAPLENGFRDSVVATSLAASQVGDPEKAIQSAFSQLGERVKVEEPWSSPEKPVVVQVEEPKYSRYPLQQLLYLHLREDGSGVLFTCTTTREQFSKKRSSFEEIVEKANFNIAECVETGELPKVFPTPEVTLSPAP